MSQTIINLSPKDKMLTGKYSKDHDIIVVVLDTRLNVPFDVYLPDLTYPKNREFIFKNLSYGNTGAIVTVKTINNQYIDGQFYQHEVSQGDTIGLRTNLKDTWVLTGANSNLSLNPIYLGRNGKREWRLMVYDDGTFNIDYDTLAGATANPVWSDGYASYDGRGTFG